MAKFELLCLQKIRPIPNGSPGSAFLLDLPLTDERWPLRYFWSHPNEDGGQRQLCAEAHDDQYSHRAVMHLSKSRLKLFSEHNVKAASLASQG